MRFVAEEAVTNDQGVETYCPETSTNMYINKRERETTRVKTSITHLCIVKRLDETGREVVLSANLRMRTRIHQWINHGMIWRHKIRSPIIRLNLMVHHLSVTLL